MIAAMLGPARLRLACFGARFSAIRTLGGTSQHATADTPFATPLQARVTDSHGRPVAGISVVFELPSGASGTFAGSAAMVTNANGVATARVVTPNTTVGSFTVNAWVAGVASPATFRLTNTAGPAAGINSVGERKRRRASF